MWKRTFLFFLVTQFFSLGTWERFVEHWAKNSALFSTQQNTCAEEQFAVFSERKCFSFLYFGREIFQTLRITSPKKYSVFHFLCSDDILVLFTRDLGFFGLEFKCLSFGRTVFNSVFKSAFKVWKSDLVFFINHIFFSWNLIIFLLKVGQKSCGCFLKAAKNVRRRTIWYLLPEKMLFRFSTLNGKLPDFEKNFSKSTQSFIFCVQKKNLVIFCKWKLPLVKYFERKTSGLWSKVLRQKSQFFIFRVQRTFWFLFPGDLGFFGL